MLLVKFLSSLAKQATKACQRKRNKFDILWYIINNINCDKYFVGDAILLVNNTAMSISLNDIDKAVLFIKRFDLKNK